MGIDLNSRPSRTIHAPPAHKSFDQWVKLYHITNTINGHLKKLQSSLESWVS